MAVAYGAFPHSSGNQGSARTLNGKIYVLICFIGPRAWTQEECLEFTEIVKEAENWIQSQAARYGTPIAFENGFLGNNSPIIMQVGNGEDSQKETDILLPAISQLGYESTQQLGKWIVDNAHCDNYLAIIASNQKGRPYAMPFAKGNDEKYFLESCVIYTKPDTETGKFSVSASSIAHEMMHLFGAVDLYETHEVSPAQAAEAKKLYPNDIMRRLDSDINTLNIGKQTAWRLGLPVPYDPAFNFFDPKRYR